MRNRTFLLCVAAAVGIAGSTLIPLAAQHRVATEKPHTAATPRLADGRPDLQGTYDLATLTPVERRQGMPLTLSEAEAGKLEQDVAGRTDALAAPIKGDRAAPPKGGDGSPGPYGNVGGYNNFWLDPGSHYTVIDGQKRASLIIDPADGRVPPVTPDAQQRRSTSDYAPRPTSDQAAREDDPGFEGPTAYDDPEIRPLAERCLLGFSSTSGPPILPTYFYNNLHQIVQTPDHLIILTEMVHDARVIRLNAQHPPQSVRKWLGDSVGHWEGDTLVVDTTNFTDKTRFRGSSDHLHIVERFSRIDARTLRYQFTVDDPSTWTRDWTGEYAWPLTDSLIYEYACHEGNYALGNILRGARQKERDESVKQ